MKNNDKSFILKNKKENKKQSLNNFINQNFHMQGCKKNKSKSNSVQISAQSSNSSQSSKNKEKPSKSLKFESSKQISYNNKQFEINKKNLQKKQFKQANFPKKPEQKTIQKSDPNNLSKSKNLNSISKQKFFAKKNQKINSKTINSTSISEKFEANIQKNLKKSLIKEKSTVNIPKIQKISALQKNHEEIKSQIRVQPAIKVKASKIQSNTVNIQSVKSTIFKYTTIFQMNLAQKALVAQNWKDMITKASLVTLSVNQFEDITQLINFCFEQLRNKNFFQKNQKASQKFLWQNIFSFMGILQYFLCERQCVYQKEKQFSQQKILFEQNLMYCSINLLLKITSFLRKKIFPQYANERINQIKGFFKVCVSKVISYSYQIQFLKKNGNWLTMQETQYMRQKLQLPLFDWGLLSIKSRDFSFFKEIISTCWQFFMQIYQQCSFSERQLKRQSFHKTDAKRRATIMEVPIQLQNSNQWNQDLDPANNVKIQHQTLQTGCHQPENIQTQLQQRQKLQNWISQQINCLRIFCNFLKMTWFSQIPHINKQKMEIQVKLQECVNNQTFQDRNQIKAYELFIFVISYKDIFYKLITQIDIIDPSLIPEQISKGLIKLAHQCDYFKFETNMDKIITEILKHDRYTKILQSSLMNQKKIINRLSSCLRGNLAQNKHRFSLKDNFQKNQFQQIKSKNIKKNNSQNIQAQKKQNPTWRSTIIQSCQSIFYIMQNIIQKAIPYLNVKHYEKQFVQKPQIFLTEMFFPKLLQNQTIQNISSFLQCLVTAQIQKRRTKIKTTDLMKYFKLFCQHCLKIHEQNYIGIFILGLQNQVLIQFNQMVYIQSVDIKYEKKFHLPEFNNQKNRLALILSAGAYQKHIIIDRFFPQTAEQLLWRQIWKRNYPLDTQMDYFIPKCFYGTIYYEFFKSKFNKEAITKIQYFIDNLASNIDKGKIVDVCSIFHLIMVILQVTKEDNQIIQLKPILQDIKSRNNRQSLKLDLDKQKQQIICQSIFEIIIQKQKRILDLYKQNEESQMKTLRNLNLTEQQNKYVMNKLTQYKKIHQFFLQNIVRFFQMASISFKFIEKLKCPEEYMEIISSFSKNTGIFCFQLIQSISKVSANQIYNKLIEQRLKNQQYLKSIVDFYLLKNLTLSWILKMKKNQYENSKKILNEKKNRSKKFINQVQEDQIISFSQIMSLCLQMLQRKIEGSLQRQVMRCKVMALQIIKIIEDFLYQNSSQLPLIVVYNQKYLKRLRKILIKLILREKTLVSKYQRQLLINIRLFILNWMIESFEKKIKLQNKTIILLEFVEEKQFWYLLYTLSFDQMVQIRTFLISSWISRFKTKQFSQFQKKKSHIWAISLIMGIYQPQNKLKKLCKIVINTIKNETLQVEILLQTIIICLHFLINFNYQYLIKTKTKKLNENFFSQTLSQAFIDKKEMEYGLFLILITLLDNSKYCFQKLKLKHQGQLIFYYLRAGGDVLHPKRQYFDLMDELKTCGEIPLYNLQSNNSSSFQESQVIFHKLQKETLQSMRERVKQNGKSGRIIKGKKQMVIDWSQLQRQGIIAIKKEFSF